MQQRLKFNSWNQIPSKVGVVVHLSLCHFGNPKIFLGITASDTNQPMLLEALFWLKAKLGSTRYKA
jgi:hypothetical protein